MKNILLAFVSIVMATLLFAAGFVTWCVMRLVKDDRETYATGTGYFFEIAYGMDVLGNAVCCELFNLILIRHGGYRFGRRGETISSALGRNALGQTLSGTGRLFRKIIDRLDPVPNHCIRNIQAL